MDRSEIEDLGKSLGVRCGEVADLKKVSANAASSLVAAYQ